MAEFNKAAIYEAALRKIADLCPATQEMTLAHQMAEEAEEALATGRRSDALQTLADIDRNLIGHDETMANLDALTIRK